MPLGGLEEGEGKLRKNTNFELGTAASRALGIERGGEEANSPSWTRSGDLKNWPDRREGDGELDRRRRGKKSAASGGRSWEQNPSCRRVRVGKKGGGMRQSTREP
jgi:hypothetical protein